MSKIDKVLKGRITLSLSEKNKICKLVRNPNFNELKVLTDHGRLWSKCSGAYA